MPRCTCPAGTRLYLQHHGNMHMDGRRMAGVPHYFQSASDRVAKDMWVPVPCLTGLLRHKAGLVLFDLGCSADWKARWAATGIGEMVPYDDWTPEQSLEATLARDGIAPSDIDLIVLSHLHMDHCGNLELFDRTRASILIQQDELDFAMAVPAPGRGGYVTSEFTGFELGWRPVSGDVSLMEGVDVLALPGHSPGTQGMLIDLQTTGRIVLASDAAQVAANLDGHGSPNTYDSVSWRRSIERLRRLRDEDGALIVCGHEPSQLQTLKFSPDFYL